MTDTSQPEGLTPNLAATQIVRVGDVLAAGLTNGKCPVGQVAAVSDQGFRLALYSWPIGYFSAGTAVVLWSQVGELAFASQREDDVFEMDPLAEFQSAWTKAARDAGR